MTPMKPNWLDKKEYPFNPHYFMAAPGNLHYVDDGQGRPIVFVHGNPAWSFLYRNPIKALSPKYRCVAPDLLGFGLSEKPRDWSYLPQDHAAVFESFVESLGLTDMTLVVGDWGGPIGLSYAIKHPEKVSKLVITNSWMWPVDKDWYYRAFSGFMGGSVGRWLIRRHHYFVNGVMKKAFGNLAKLSPEIHRCYRLPLADPTDRRGCWVFPKQIVGATPWLTELWNQRHRIVDKPALLVWGMKDIAFREKELNRWIELFYKAQVCRLPETGHFVAEESPEALTRAIADFIQ